MAEMKDTTFRCLRMLMMIPRYPGSTTVSILQMKLSEIDYDISGRTVQRDLIKLSEIFPILCINEEQREKQWTWRKDIGLLDLPNMSPLTSLTFTLLKQYLSRTLPLSICRNLDPYFNCAQNYLDGLEKTNIGRWHEKIRIIPRGQQLIPANIEDNTLEVIYKALLLEKQFQGVYKPRGSSETKNYSVHPLGLVFRPEIIYLLCTLRDYSDVKQLALHRFKSVTPLDTERRVPESFDLDEYISKHMFSYPIEASPIQLEALFDSEAAEHLYEIPLSENQTLSVQADGRVLLSAEVIDTYELRWWLQGFGDLVEVKKPKELREAFKQKVAESYKRYHIEC